MYCEGVLLKLFNFTYYLGFNKRKKPIRNICTIQRIIKSKYRKPRVTGLKTHSNDIEEIFRISKKLSSNFKIFSTWVLQISSKKIQ